ncbi:MAG: helix-turn-helix transcriptional regulator [Ruminococcus sp.]|nr:helix-turn-helix transcriptional regulator [Ruminococcus sp.]
MLHLRLLELRKSKGLTQVEMAKLLKITPQAYSLYETNKNNISNETLCILADFFEVSTDYLLGRQEEIPSFLNERERFLIELYRSLDDRARDNYTNAMIFESDRLKSGMYKKQNQQ